VIWLRGDVSKEPRSSMLIVIYIAYVAYVAPKAT